MSQEDKKKVRACKHCGQSEYRTALELKQHAEECRKETK